ncbi:MAG: transposase [Candidatus Tectimicrobiota bacterium]
MSSGRPALLAPASCIPGADHSRPPHLHDFVPGGGLSADRTTWRSSRANFVVSVNALAPISRALCTAALRHAGRLEPIAPQVWTIPWNVHRQAQHHGHSAFTALAPYGFRVALSHRRIVSRTDRTVTCAYRNVGSARPRTAHLDVMALLRRFLPHVLPDGLMNVRPCGLLPASWAIHPDTLRRLIVQACPIDGPPTPRSSWQPAWPAARPGAHRCASSGACGPPPGLWSRQAARNDGARTPSVRHGWSPLTAPVRPSPALSRQRTTAGGTTTAYGDANTVPSSPDEAPMAMPHHGLRHTIPPLP